MATLLIIFFLYSSSWKYSQAEISTSLRKTQGVAETKRCNIHLTLISNN